MSKKTTSPVASAGRTVKVQITERRDRKRTVDVTFPIYARYGGENGSAWWTVVVQVEESGRTVSITEHGDYSSPDGEVWEVEVELTALADLGEYLTYDQATAADFATAGAKFSAALGDAFERARAP